MLHTCVRPQYDYIVTETEIHSSHSRNFCCWICYVDTQQQENSIILPMSRHQMSKYIKKIQHKGGTRRANTPVIMCCRTYTLRDILLRRELCEFNLLRKYNVILLTLLASSNRYHACCDAAMSAVYFCNLPP